MRRTFTLYLALLILSVVPSARSRGADPEAPPKAHVPNVATEGKLIVHEWGTFTTFSGSDGVFLDFRPLANQHSDLPVYVRDRGSYIGRSYGFKSRIRGRVRMETPVTYFYTDRLRTVDVRVDFPQGLLTEFYPPVRKVLPPVNQRDIFTIGEKIGDSSLHWGKVDLIPTELLLANRKDSPLSDRVSNNIIHKLLPHAPNEHHYAAARETDAALVHVRAKPNSAGVEESFFEKFLFYRGVGRFKLPIKASFDDDQITVTNDGQLTMNSAILIHVDGKQLLAAKIDKVAAGETLAFDNLQQVTEQQLAAMVQQSLIDEGLYEKEAASMVKTWQQSWFTEDGTRVLYMVPAPTTDELLPLHITPSPQETLRVLVGRMEIMSPEDEQRMIQAVASSSKLRADHYAKKLARGEKRKPYAIPAVVSDYGRMTEPALARVRAISRDPAIRKEAELLIAQLQRS